MKVALVKTNGYENCKEAIEKVLKLTEFKIENKQLVIKPNLLAIVTKNVTKKRNMYREAKLKFLAYPQVKDYGGS